LLFGVETTKMLPDLLIYDLVSYEVMCLISEFGTLYLWYVFQPMEMQVWP
jgi:hypothetical protein